MWVGVMLAVGRANVVLAAAFGDTCQADDRDHCILRRPGANDRPAAPGPEKELEAFAAGLTKKPPCEFPIVDYSALDENTLVDDIVKRNRPVLFSNISVLRKDQPHDWSRLDFLARFGHIKLPRQEPDTRHGDDMVTFADVANSADPPRFFLSSGPLLGSLGEDLTDEPALLYSKVASKPVLALGGMGTWNRFHKHGLAWQAQIHGSKLWWLAPPFKQLQAIPETHLSDDYGHWGGNVCGFMKQRPLSSAEYCLNTPGHAIFVPHGYFHGTCNLDEWTLSYGMQGRRTPMARAIIFDDIERYEALAEKCSAANRKRKHRHVNDNGGTESYKNHCDREDFEEFGSPLNTAAAHGNTNMILHLLQRLHNKSAH
eukprot:gnl/TRDRNA2_/TRDRNA2_174831_c0_seq11.p1 gnl/TRDRNA2_/TRDRNA2_174831_c0~~gnl/TRDRNA2_/TRDRNA2_174831_c0_seq11.p1  ORF type:complete len:371 (-),score=50.92 gnl/TRDRNA2_/TRDRNA2_174831_c0_seq11:54-1166(-)